MVAVEAARAVVVVVVVVVETARAVVVVETAAGGACAPAHPLQRRKATGLWRCLDDSSLLRTTPRHATHLLLPSGTGLGIAASTARG